MKTKKTPKFPRVVKLDQALERLQSKPGFMSSISEDQLKILQEIEEVDSTMGIGHGSTWSLISEKIEALTPKECFKLVNEAIKKFGAGAWSVKGPSEVMDMTQIMDKVNQMPTKSVHEMLCYVFNKHPKYHRFVWEVVERSEQVRSPKDFERLCSVDPDYFEDYFE